MIKKINFILILLLLLVSLSAVSAADEFNDTIASDNSDILEEVSSADVLTSDDNEIVSSNPHTVTSLNYNSYFNSKGDLISSDVQDGDTIILGDNFVNKKFNFEKSLNVRGLENYKLSNCMLTFSGGASASVISNLNIANTKNTTYGIFLNGVSNCIIKDCFINNTGVSSYAVCIANDANHNSIENNSFNTYGITYGHGTRSTPPFIISGAHYNYVANNQIACDDANGIYLSSFAGGPLRGGNSNFNIIFNNTIKYNVLPTSWAYGIQLMGENNIVEKNNVIGAYLAICGGKNTTVIDNVIINVTGADYNHPGVPVGGEGAIVCAENSIIRNNRILNAYVISTGGGIEISDNSIAENNYVQITNGRGVGIRPQGSNITIKNNTIFTTVGAGVLNYKTQFFNLYVLNNNITSQSGVGVLIQRLSAKKMPGNITVSKNTISTSNVYAIDISEADASMYYNTQGNIIIGNSIVKDPKGEYDPSKYNYEFRGKTHTITLENYGDYIDPNGGLTSNITDGDILYFSGEFSNQYIYLNKAVKVTGANPIFYNTTFRVSSDGVWIEKLTILNNRAERLNAWGILIYQITGATVLNCTIDVYDPNAAYTIYALESSQVDIINNTLSSEGNYLTYTILANSIVDSNIINNTIFTNGTGQLYTFEPEHCLDGDEVCPDGNSVCPEGNSVCPDGSSVCPDGNSVCPEGDEICPEGSSVCLEGNSVAGSHVLREVYRTYGILIVYSSDNVISGNKVRVTSKLNQTYSTYNSTNSIVGIDLYYNSHNNVFSNNDVYVWGNDNYIYGMGVLGYYTTMIAPEGQGAENNQFINNNIVLEGSYFVTGIIVGSSSENTTIRGNVIDAQSNNVSYGVTLEMSKESTIANNNIKLSSEIIYGIEIFGTESFKSDYNVINNNNFNLTAKQAYGIVISASNHNEINLNKILIIITDEDFEFKNITSKNYDVIVGGNAGLYLRSYSTDNRIDDNNITITKGYAIIIEDVAINNVISNNYLCSGNGTGNDAVNSTLNNTVKDNYAHLVVGILSDVNIKYFENGIFIFATDDENLEGAVVEFIDDYGEVINTAVISDGKATFSYDFNGFADFTPASYIFSAKVYKYNYKVTEFNNMVNIANGDLFLSVDNVEGAVARNAQYRALVRNVVGNGVEGLLVEFWVIDEGYPVYVGKATTDGNGVAVLNAEIPKIYGENPQVLAQIDNPDYYESASSLANLTAYWLTDTVMSVNSKVYAEGVLAILKDKSGNVLANKQVSVVIGGKTYNLITDSSGSVKLPAVTRGTYTISALFDGDNEYYDSKTTVKVTVLPSIVENKNYNVYYGSTIKYKVRIVGPDGKFAGAGKVVTIKVNGQTYKVSTDKNGYATKSLKLKVGTYTITSEYCGDKVSNKITVKPTLTAKNVVGKKGKNVKFTVKLVDKNGKVLKNKKITFKVKGKKYVAKTNKKGKATATIKNLKKVGKFTITSSYGGCTIKNTIKIKK